MNESDRYMLLPDVGGNSDFLLGRRMGALESQNAVLKWMLGLAMALFGSSVVFLLTKIDSTLINILDKISR